jgi:hypothetical protein
MPGHAFAEAAHGRHGGRGGVAVHVPAEGVLDRLPGRRQQLDVGERDVGAGHGVAAAEVDEQGAQVPLIPAYETPETSTAVVELSQSWERQ